MVLELKYAKSGEDLGRAADAALRQIQEKNYAAALKTGLTRKFYGCGIAFCGRECAISFKELTPEN